MMPLQVIDTWSEDGPYVYPGSLGRVWCSMLSIAWPPTEEKPEWWIVSTYAFRAGDRQAALVARAVAMSKLNSAIVAMTDGLAGEFVMERFGAGVQYIHETGEVSFDEQVITSLSQPLTGVTEGECNVCQWCNGCITHFTCSLVSMVGVPACKQAGSNREIHQT